MGSLNRSTPGTAGRSIHRFTMSPTASHRPSTPIRQSNHPTISTRPSVHSTCGLEVSGRCSGSKKSSRMSETPPCGAGADQARKLLSAARGSVCASKHSVDRAQELVEGAPHPGPVGTHRLRTAGALTRVRRRPGHRERTGRDQPTSDGQVLPFPVKVDLRLPRETLLALVAVPPPSELDRGRRKRPGRPAGSAWRTLPVPPRRAGRRRPPAPTGAAVGRSSARRRPCPHGPSRQCGPAAAGLAGGAGRGRDGGWSRSTRDRACSRCDDVPRPTDKSRAHSSRSGS